MNIELARLVIGPPEMQSHIVVEQVAENLFTVRTFLVEEGAKATSEYESFQRFANAALAFEHALKQARDEVADICDLIDG